MKEYPRTQADRERIRSVMIEHFTLKGIRRGLQYGLSLRCLNGDHGCRNTGQSCLCLCHDKKDVT